MLEIAVNITSEIFAIAFIYLYDSFNPMVICIISFIALPPSIVYTGNKVNTIIKMLAYTIVFILVFKIDVFPVNVDNMIKNTIFIKLVNGPAKAIINLFIDNLFAFFIFVL